MFKLSSINHKTIQHLSLLFSVIQADSEDYTKQICQVVNTPEEIDAMVDPTITYGKVIESYLSRNSQAFIIYELLNLNL